MASIQELLRLRNEGGLNEYEAQCLRESKPVEELFDTDVDPHELHTFAGDPAYEDILIEMGAELERWMERTNDPGILPEN